MNEFSEHSTELPKTQEFLKSVEQSETKFSFKDLIDEVNDFVSSTEDFIKDLTTHKDNTAEVKDVREYGLKECSDAAKEIFTTKVISEWGSMSYEQRNQIVQDYSKSIANGLDINFKGIIFEPLMEQLGALGYNSGDGYIHLDNCYITNPGQIIGVIDTVAHEARHQFQTEAINSPEKFGIDQATINEWAAGINSYTTKEATSYDPWGYFYNPIEIDARYFGESMVRELTKEIINNA